MKITDLNVPEDRLYSAANYPKPGIYKVRGELYRVTSTKVMKMEEHKIEVTQPINGDIVPVDLTNPCFYQIMLNVILATACALLAIGYAS